MGATHDANNGPHLYQTCPSGNVYEYYATAIGARSQSGKTYLEKHYESFGDASREEMILHALRALAGCVSGDDELTKANGSIGIVGADESFKLIEGDDLQYFLDKLEVEGTLGGGDDDDDDEDAAEPAVEESKEESGDAEAME